MKNLFSFFLVIVCMSPIAQVQKVFENIENSNLQEAKVACDENISSNIDVVDSYMLKTILQNLEDDAKSHLTFKKGLEEMEEKNPYLYALWFTHSVTSGYGKKDNSKVAFFNQIVGDEYNHTIKDASKYVLGHHFASANNFTTCRSMWGQINALTKWEFVGTFANPSGSGFDKDYSPITSPEKTSKFVNQDQANVYWFTPPEEKSDPWMTFNNVFTDSEGIIYAQTYINNPEDRDVILSLGGQGSFRVWINETEVISQEEEMLTEMDNIKVKVFLPQGKHRVLLQLGYTSKSSLPNFLLRFLDLEEKPIIPLNNSAGVYNSKYDNVAIEVKEEIPHFAEVFFNEKITNDPENILNHILLAKSYRRAKKNNQAIAILNQALEVFPNNVIIHYELLRNFQEIDDRTELLKEVEIIRSLSDDFLFLDYYDYGIAKSNEDLDAMELVIEKLEAKLGANDAQIIEYKIEVASTKQDYVTLMELIERGYSLYPENKVFVKLQYIVEKQVDQKSSSLKILEKFLKKNYSFSLSTFLIGEYTEAGRKDKAEKLVLSMHQNSPNELSLMDELLIYSFDNQDFGKAISYCDKTIKQAPFRARSHLNRAYVNMATRNNEEAVKDLNRAIELDPNLFEARERLREITDKQSFVTLIKNKNNEEVIKEKLKEEDDSDFSYKFVFYEESHIQFEEGAGLGYTNIGIKILNESGIDSWKEASIPVSYYWEDLVVVNSVVYTKDGQRIEAERNYNQLVFPSLGVGDIVHIEYRKDKYTGGSLAEEFFLDYGLSSSVPMENVSYKLITPKGFKYNENHMNISEEAKEYDFDEFNCKEWYFEYLPAIDDEYFMPPIEEVGKTINISTMDSWSEVSEWYQDLALPMAKEDYKLEQAYKAIFDNEEFDSEMDKHKAIYNYICDEIKYSSVSFRQSSYVPQKPMVTLSTKLGDCKDVSLLYHTLANKAGLTSNLVLVNTRDNGENQLQLPSVGFNHCIIRIEVEDEPFFMELTDNKLPFGAMYGSLENSQALIIPNSQEDMELGAELIRIPKNNIIANKIHREININIVDENLELETDIVISGYEASNYRSYFSDVTESDLKVMLKEYFSDFFEEEIEVVSNEFKNLEEKEVAYEQGSSLKVFDKVKKMGSIKSLEIPFFEKIATLDAFPNEERKYSYDYWSYENYDTYETEIVITIPSENEIVEVPVGNEIKNSFIDYKVEVEQIDPHTIKIVRTVSPKRKTFEAAEYELIRESVKKIVKTEDMYIVYK